MCGTTINNLININKPRNMKLYQLLTGSRVYMWPINPSAYFYHKSLHEIAGPYNIDEHYALDLDFILRAIQYANIKYIDEVLGNWRYIQGTKSVEDFKSGTNVDRAKKVLRYYRKDLNSIFRKLYPLYVFGIRIFSFFRLVSRFIYRKSNFFLLPFLKKIPRSGAVFEMYSKAKQKAYADLETTTSLKVTLPWVTQEFENTRKLMGENYWPYGIERNRKELELVMRYTYEQGLVKRRLNFEELFHPSTLKLEENMG